MQGTEKGLALFNSAQNESTMLQQAKPLLWTTQNMIRSATCAKLGGGSRHHSLRIVNERATDEKRLKSDKMKTAMPSPFRHRRLVSGPMLFPHSFRFHCKCCKTGCSMVWCGACDGEGKVLTKPGGAGVPFKVGMARCGICNGIGVVPCPLCGGIELELPPPDPDKGPKMTEAEIKHIFSIDWASKLAEY